MIGRRSVIGIAVLCALAVSAFATSSASASTAFTCKTATAPEGFKAGHCRPADAVATGAKFEHVAIPPNSNTAVAATNAHVLNETKDPSPAVLEGTASGIATAIECSTVAGMGTLNNKEEAGVMFAHVTGTLEYTGCKVTKPAGKSCVVTGGAVTTKELTGKTLSATQAEIKPAAGEEFASIPISGCTVEGLNNTFPVTGSLVATLDGATVTAVHGTITTQGKLKFAGQKAGLGGSITLGMETPVVDGNAISVT